jgi:hypothetical protein
MPREKDFKRHVRTRMARTGERYTKARQGLRGGDDHFSWHLAGGRRDVYEHTEAADPRHPSAAIQILRCTGDPEGGFGTVMTNIDAADYRGRRIRCSAEVPAEGVTGWSGLWMRVDGKEQGDMLGFDNMHDRPLEGTFDWRPVDVILDVPSEAERLAFGLLLTGPGTVQLAGVRLRPVSLGVPVTGNAMSGSWHSTGPPWRWSSTLPRRLSRYLTACSSWARGLCTSGTFASRPSRRTSRPQVAQCHLQAGWSVAPVLTRTSWRS